MSLNGTIRVAKNEDRCAITTLMLGCFGYIDYTVLDNIVGHCIVYEHDSNVIAFTNLYAERKLGGFRIGLSCTDRTFQFEGVMTELLSYVVKNLGVGTDLYCYAWRLPNREYANLYVILKRLGFTLLKRGAKKGRQLRLGRKVYTNYNCERGCPYSEAQNEIVFCSCNEDLYVRRS